MIDLTPIFQAVLALLAALITYKLVPWIKARTTDQQQQNLVAAAKIAVYAAEQIFGSGHGEEKLQYAIDALKRAGYNVDTQLVREAVENAVKFMTEYKATWWNLTPSEEPEDNLQTHPPQEPQSQQDTPAEEDDLK